MPQDYVFGKHSVTHVLEAKRRKVFRLYCLRSEEKAGYKEIIALARQRQVQVQIVEDRFFQKHPAAFSHHQGIVADVEPYPYVGFETLLQKERLLFLDEIQDNHNLGALCRSALLFGFDGVVISETHAASVGPGAVSTSAGAVEYLSIARVSSIAQALIRTRDAGFWSYGLDMEGQKEVSAENFPAKVALVIGREEKGLRKLVRERVDILLRIPMKASAVDSLNASVSGAVVMYEVMKQKK